MSDGRRLVSSAAGAEGRGHGRRVVAALALTQTIGYGVLYYAFSVLLSPMRHDLDASGPQVAAALTVAVLTAALCAPLVGRLLDAHGGRGLMTAGSVLGTLAVLGLVPGHSLPQLYAVFPAIGSPRRWCCTSPPSPSSSAGSTGTIRAGRTRCWRSPSSPASPPRSSCR